MKSLIYVNKEKDPLGYWVNILKCALEKNKIEYLFINEDNLQSNISADCLFIIGGDGTILDLADFSSRNNIPVIGINAGNLGFLTEFDKDEIENAVLFLVSNNLVKDNRILLEIEFNNKVYTALNDLVIERVYSPTQYSLIIDLEVKINDTPVEKLLGNGIIISTPTGSTAYSLSAGGSILAPSINAFSLTPICDHSFFNKPVIYSADTETKITFSSGGPSGIFIDGKFISLINNNETVLIRKSKRSMTFLRNKSFNFFNCLTSKFKGGK